MGGESSRLHLENCNSEARLNEIRRCKLSHVTEAIEYWNSELFRRKKLYYKHFNEVFGPLVSDTELHFRDFVQADKKRGDARCVDASEAFAAFILLSHESLQPKVKFLFDFFGKQDTKSSKRSIQHVLQASARGMSRLFNAEAPTALHLDNLIETSLFSSPVEIRGSIEDHLTIATFTLSTASAVTSTYQLSFPIIWQWCQDNKDIYDYLGMITNITFKTGLMKYNTMVEDSQRSKTTVSNLTSDKQTGERTINHAFHRSSRNALWSYRMSDVIRDEWIKDLVSVDLEDNVFDVIQIMVLTKCSAVAVMESLKEDGLRRTWRQTKRGKYVGMIDQLSLISWLVRCYPENFPDVSNSTHESKKSRSKGQTIVDCKDMMLNIAMLTTAQKGDRTREDIPAVELKKCQEIGVQFATATIRHVLKELQMEEEQQGFNVYSDGVTLHTGEYIYPAIYLFAKGYRNVAIRIAPAIDSKIVCILKDTDMASFVHSHSLSILGEAKFTAAQHFPMKLPLSISMKSTYAMACKMLATKRVGCCIILDSMGRYGGRFEAASICDLWCEWRKQYCNHWSKDFRKHPGISDIYVPPDPSLTSTPDEYTYGNYTVERVINLSDPVDVHTESLYDEATYKVFGVLLSCLTSCDHLGIFCDDFDASISCECEEIWKRDHLKHHEFSESVTRNYFRSSSERSKIFLNKDLNEGYGNGDDSDDNYSLGSTDLSESLSNHRRIKKEEDCLDLDVNEHKRDFELAKIAKSSAYTQKISGPRPLPNQSTTSRTSAGESRSTITSSLRRIGVNVHKNLISTSKIHVAYDNCSGNKSSTLRRRPSMLRRSKWGKMEKPSRSKILQEVLIGDAQMNIVCGEGKDEQEKRRLRQWFQENGLISLHDPIAAALEAMARHHTSRAFVADEKGRALGVITFKDIAFYIVNEEAEQKQSIRKDIEEEDTDYMPIDDI